MITLYGSGMSRSFRVAWALEEAGLNYNYETMTPGKPTEEYKLLNVQGKVPTLVHDAGEQGVVITESAAAVNYIASLAPEKQLIPTDLSQRAYYDEISFFILSDLEQPLWSNGKHRFVLPEEHRIAQMLDTANWEFNRSLQYLERHLKGKSYIVPEQFTMADILMAHTIMWAHSFKFEVPEYALSYMNQLIQRPAFAAAKARVTVAD